MEIFRQGLSIVSDVCISSDGPVRSIFLLHRGPLQDIRSIALDSSSRTSVALAKIVLAERYGVWHLSEQILAPDPAAMLSVADSALLIGDPALQLNTVSEDFQICDLGSEWQKLTGLPMVYAAWASKTAPDNPELFRQSYEYGHARIEEIVKLEAPKRRVPAKLAERYFTSHIQFDLSPRAAQGLREFRRLAEQHGLL